MAITDEDRTGHPEVVDGQESHPEPGDRSAVTIRHISENQIINSNTTLEEMITEHLPAYTSNPEISYVFAPPYKEFDSEETNLGYGITSQTRIVNLRKRCALSMVVVTFIFNCMAGVFSFYYYQKMLNCYARGRFLKGGKYYKTVGMIVIIAVTSGIVGYLILIWIILNGFSIIETASDE